MIIDAHVYCLPHRLRQPDADLPGDEPAVEAIHRHPDGPLALSLSSPEAILDSMARSGIDRSLLVALPWTSPALCRETNEHLEALCRATPLLMWLGAVSPARPGAVEEARRCLMAGAKGIKVNPAWQGFDPAGPEAAAICDLAQEWDVPVMVHVDHPFRRDSSALPGGLLAMARRNPGVTLLAAHLGGLLGLYHHHAPMRSDLDNIWYDTAVSSTMDMVGYYFQAGLGDRVVFGTDFPFNHCHDQSFPLARARGLGLSPREARGLFCNNLRRLLRLGEEEAC